MPSTSHRVPVSTYRLQIRPAFGFADAAAQADYLAALGVTHVYLSPILQPAPGSTHGYDVVDHDRLNDEAGGRAAFDILVRELEQRGLRLVADVVPNHMTVPTPMHLNAPFWSLLREGRASAFARWFDVDWAAGGGKVLMPVLGAPLEQVLADGELTVAGGGGPAGDEPVLCYYDHELPVRPGTQELPLADLLEAQAYRLAEWRIGAAELNYRRFFDVTTLAAIRVEDPEVFDQTHALLLELVADGSLAGLRIDHPDGLADPRGYLARLADRTGGVWVVAEKILEGDEQLPTDWRCAGTTGYDALLRIGGIFVDPAGAQPLSELLESLTGESRSVDAVVEQAKNEVVESVQAAEVSRLVRLLATLLPAQPASRLRRVVSALLVGMDRYRAYVTPGEPPAPEQAEAVGGAVARARSRLEVEDHDALAAVRDLVLDRAPAGSDPDVLADFVIRFQQTCGPVMAKGIEDTAFYRYARLIGLNEVGGDPATVGVSPRELLDFADRIAAVWPTTMTALSTHDTKRSEDVRARLAVLSERPGEWAEWVGESWRCAAPHRSGELDPQTEYFLWQTLVGTWPIEAERLHGYADKAVREAKLHTSWTDPDGGYESAVHRWVDGVLGDRRITHRLEDWIDGTWEDARAVVLGQKLLQLVHPGVPDVYQGSELLDLSLVDPDNRRPVDFTDRSERLAALDAGERPRDLSDEKLLVTSRALRLRRDHAEWFTGGASVHQLLPASSDHALAIGRGDGTGLQVVGVVTRLGATLVRDGGWDQHTLSLPPGRWTNLLGPRGFEGSVRLCRLLADLPVALLVRAHG